MHPFARASASRAGLSDGRFDIVTGFAESLPFPDESFDAVVATMVFCSVSDMGASVREIRRVLKPGRRFAFIEHVAAPPGTLLRSLQTTLDPLQQIMCDGCHLARDVLPAIEAPSIFSAVNAARFSLDDEPALAAAVAASGGADAAVAALRAASADGGAGWALGAPLRPHFLLSPHVIGTAIA
jgi:SAM-dependent methyltransferase